MARSWKQLSDTQREFAVEILALVSGSEDVEKALLDACDNILVDKMEDLEFDLGEARLHVRKELGKK